MSENTPELRVEDVVRRWRLMGNERPALDRYADESGMTVQDAKAHLVAVGIWEAYLDTTELAERFPVGAKLLKALGTRALRYARRELRRAAPVPGAEQSDGVRAPDSDRPDARLLAPDDSPTDRPHLLEAFRRIATSAQEGLLLDAIEEGCTSHADVDRHYLWSHGHAAMVARRLAAKAKRAGVIAARIPGVTTQRKGPVTVRRAIPDDAPWLLERIRLLASSNLNAAVFPADPGDALAAVRRRIEQRVTFLAEDATGPLGFVAGGFDAGLELLGVRVLQEELWWSVDGPRSATVAARLLDAFIAHGREHATHVRFSQRIFSRAGEPHQVSNGGLRTLTSYVRRSGA